MAKKEIIENPRRTKTFAVELWSESLKVTFQFENLTEAESFIETAAKSISVSGIVLLIDGKFSGARDGGGS